MVEYACFIVSPFDQNIEDSCEELAGRADRSKLPGGNEGLQGPLDRRISLASWGWLINIGESMNGDAHQPQSLLVH